MASITSPTTAHGEYEGATLGNDALAVLKAIGSLKLTVALFAFSLVLVLVGTLAQDELNMLQVKQRYFLSWIAMLRFDDFVPQAFYRHDTPLPGVIPFPGGALIGALLMINLIAAKTTRFRIHTSGGTLAAGIGFLIAGCVVAGLIIFSGHSSEGLQGTPPIAYDRLWAIILAALTIGVAGFGFAGMRASNRTLTVLSFVAAAAVGAFILFSLTSGFRIGDPGLRIVWQLTKGLGAGVILLIGCLLVFDKQGGNVLLHLGVGLLMVGQFVFGDRQLEQRLSLVEGESTNTLVNLDAVELTFIQVTDGAQHITAIPGSRLLAAAKSGELIQDDPLPVNVRVVEFMENSTLEDIEDENLADTGIGLQVRAASAIKSGGADSEINLPSAYVELLDKESGDSMGTYLVSQAISDREMLMPGGGAKNVFDKITVAETDYEIGLRYHREVKPYWVQLEDVRRIDYSGTNTPRDYSSFIRIVDPETGEDRKERVWMNNPLRYRGETFYQSNYTPLPGGKEMTGIQVVRNSGWLIPYLACSITGLGMLVHFLGTLMRFSKRRQRETRKEFAQAKAKNTAADPFTNPVVTPSADSDTQLPSSPPSRKPVVFAVAACALFATYFLVPWSEVSSNGRPTERAAEFDFYAAGKIPTQFGGRVMPLDAYARQTLKAISNKESLPLDDAPSGIADRSSGRRLSAIQWLMEVAIDEQKLHLLPMFRIDAEEVRSELGLERRESKLYSLDDIRSNLKRFTQLVEAAREKDPIDQSFKEKKLLELDRRTQHYTLTAAAFRLPIPPNIPAEFFPEGTDEQTRQLFALRELERQLDSLARMQPPAIIPPSSEVASDAVDDPKWTAFGPAFFTMIKTKLKLDDPAPAGIDSFGEMIKAYGDQDKLAFNEAVDAHLAEVNAYPIPGYQPRLVSLERWMQTSWPTGVATALYLITLVMGFIYFAVDMPRLRQSVWGILLLAFAIHTLAIVCRIMITGRAPVINLYSSAVFIGWGAVLFGIVVERIFRYGTGNMLASASGVLTLLVAYGLNKGDTMPVLQAVLDTQFWLATHVISVTLGYVATLVAGSLGVGYLIAGWLGNDSKSLREIYRICYGAACFGILFSFIGTVLGGLWADDSWGRFWGWDPKENGALLIVIWNALMLHARWDGMVGAKGFSILAIGGNIVTAWSWFGTNELGIGLHAYGGFASPVRMWLCLFVATQLAFIVVGVMTRSPKGGSTPAV